MLKQNRTQQQLFGDLSLLAMDAEVDSDIDQISYWVYTEEFTFLWEISPLCHGMFSPFPRERVSEETAQGVWLGEFHRRS